MPFKPGQSGNPKGRPPKSRALTALLERGGNAKYGDMPTAAKKLFAQRVWEGLATGKIQFDDNTVIQLEAKDFVALAKLVLSQVDGPPPSTTSIDVPGNGTLVFNIASTPPDADEEGE